MRLLLLIPVLLLGALGVFTTQLHTAAPEACATQAGCLAVPPAVVTSLYLAHDTEVAADPM